MGAGAQMGWRVNVDAWPQRDMGLGGQRLGSTEGAQSSWSVPKDLGEGVWGVWNIWGKHGALEGWVEGAQRSWGLGHWTLHTVKVDRGVHHKDLMAPERLAVSVLETLIKHTASPSCLATGSSWAVSGWGLA